MERDVVCRIAVQRYGAHTHSIDATRADSTGSSLRMPRATRYKKIHRKRDCAVRRYIGREMRYPRWA